MNFQNKIAVITGSTTGIGEAVAKQLHIHGAKVIIVARSSEQAKQKAKQLSSQGQQAMGIGCDVSQPEQVRQMIDEVIERFGRLDYAVNNAGLTGDHGKNITKHGIIGLTQTAALEFACQGIRVNAVAPGYVQTPRMSALPENIVHSFANSHPMKRMAKMQEIADFILFLLSDKSAFCTGGVYPIDGGYLAE